MNPKENHDIWADINSRAVIAFALSIIALAVVYLVFFK